MTHSHDSCPQTMSSCCLYNTQVGFTTRNYVVSLGQHHISRETPPTSTVCNWRSESIVKCWDMFSKQRRHLQVPAPYTAPTQGNRSH